MIYILDNDPKLCAQALDDKSLDKMIKDIAQVLCNVHWIHCSIKREGHLVYSYNKNILLWDQWARECRANYLYLVDLGWEILRELNYRNIESGKTIQLVKVMAWARDTVPDLPGSGCQCYEKECPLDLFVHTVLPLIIPTKYIKHGYDAFAKEYHNNIVGSYRNYYQAKLIQRIYKAEDIKNLNTIVHTKRNKPEWLNL